MSVEEKIVCIGCPMGCLVTLTINDKEAAAFEGNKCKQGEKYVLEEYRNPVRILTTTLVTQGSSQKLLPVRTAMPIPKTKMIAAMKTLSKIKVKPPIKIGEVVIDKSVGIGANVVATADLPY